MDTDMNDINNCLSFNNVKPQPLTLTSSSSSSQYQKYPRKKRRTENIMMGTDRPCSCSECGKKFRSWKALFGHMRCHPERQWRGINPPPNFHRRPPLPEGEETNATMTEEDHEVATCLLMLANQSPFRPRYRVSCGNNLDLNGPPAAAGSS